MIVLAVAITLNFMLPRLMPGDPLRNIVGDGIERMSPEEIAA
ncbi:MAG: peptide ABC transporter permease, partial [Chloroflexi bacterium]